MGILGPAALGSQNWGMHRTAPAKLALSGEQNFCRRMARQPMIAFGLSPVSVQKQIGFCSGPCGGRKGGYLKLKVLLYPKAFPSGRCPSAHTGADEGATLYQTFPCRKGVLPLVASTAFFFCPVGQVDRPSSVTFGDSFPQGEASGLCSPTRKKRSKSGYADGHRNSPRQPFRCAPPPLWGSRGKAPGSFSPFSREKWGPLPGRRAPRALRPEAPEKAQPPAGVRSTPPRPRTGRGTYVVGLDLWRFPTGPPT